MTDKPKQEGAVSERLAKRIASAGICSRRDAEKLILEGKVTVNRKQVVTPAFTVTASDVVRVDGKVLAEKEEPKLWLYHKPSGLVTSHRDEKGRETVFSNLPKELGRVISVGRLDLNSEGLLLLTNDGGLARKLELPSSGWIRRYRVRAYGEITPLMLEKMAKSVTVEGIAYGSIEAIVDSKQGHNTWLTVSLKEGKNREIRKVFEHFGCQVSRLLRTSYGPFQLGKIARGEVKEVPARMLKSFLPNE